MSLPGGVQITGFLSPTASGDTYATHDGLYGRDGLRNVDLLTDLDNISDDRRRAGMIVGVSGNTGQPDYYSLGAEGTGWTHTIADWSLAFLSPSATTDTYTTGATLVGATAYYNTTASLSAYTLDLSSLDVNDTFISGMTFNVGTYDLTLHRNDAVNFTQSLSILSGDMVVTGGTYNINTGIVTFTNNSGGTFNVSGFTSGMTDSYTTTAYTTGNVIHFDNNIQGSDIYQVDLTPVISGFTTGDTSPFRFNTGTTTAIEPILGINSAVDTYSTIGGGALNSIGGSTSGYHTIGGGKNNTITGGTWGYNIIAGGGYGSIPIYGNNIFDSNWSFIGGGYGNHLYNNSNYSNIIGGVNNTITGNLIGGGNSTKSTIGGGQSNFISGATSSFIGGGSGNQMIRNGTIPSLNNNVIGGGSANEIRTGILGKGIGINSDFSFIGSGYGNVLTGSSACNIVGGQNHIIGYSNFSSIIGGKISYIDNSDYSVIVGGHTHLIRNSEISIIGSGAGNGITGGTSLPLGHGNSSNVIGGGNANFIFDNFNTVIGGGKDNIIKTEDYVFGLFTPLGEFSGSRFGNINGGYNNHLGGSQASVIGGGHRNVINSSNLSTIGGGEGNTILIGDGNGGFGFIGGGSGNIINSGGTTSTIIGGSGNTINHSHSHIIGSNITSLSANTTHIEKLNISTLNDTASVTSLGIDVNGFVVSASTASGPSKYVESFGFTAATTSTITHNLGSTDVLVQVKDASGQLIIPNTVDNYTTNSVDINVSSTETMRVIIIG